MTAAPGFSGAAPGDGEWKRMHSLFQEKVRASLARGSAPPPPPGVEPLESRTLMASTPLASIAAVPLPAPSVEVRVNTFTRDHQRSPSVAVDADGDYVVTWESYQQEDLDWNIYAQRYAADGTPRGGEFRVNMVTDVYHTDSSVAMDAVGNFVVTWTQGALGQVWARRFYADGTPRADEFIVDFVHEGAGTASVAMNASGDWVVAWDISGEDDRRDVFVQGYAGDGGGRTGIMQVNSNVVGSAWTADVAIDGDGDFAVAFQVSDSIGLSGTYVRRYDRSALVSLPASLVSFGASPPPAVAMGADGSFVVAWGVGDTLTARRYLASGIQQGLDVAVAVGPAGKTQTIDVTADASRNFLVTWAANGTDGTADVLARGYTSEGAAVGAAFRLNSYVASQQTNPAAALRADGSFVAAWNSWNQDGSLTGVYARRFSNTAPPAATVVGRRVFYNRSAFDGLGGLPNASDDLAVATDKSALLPGRLPDFSNITSYDRGINGVMVDVAGLPDGVVLAAGDFTFRAGTGADRATWSAGPTPAAVYTRQIAPGRSRVTLMWRDYEPEDAKGAGRAVANAWLEVTLPATARTGLASSDVFYFGNLIGETGGENPAGIFDVSGVDIGRVRVAQVASGAAINNPYDFNRDGRVNAIDVSIVRSREQTTIPLLYVARAAVASTAPTSAARRTRGAYATSLLGLARVV